MVAVVVLVKFVPAMVTRVPPVVVPLLGETEMMEGFAGGIGSVPHPVAPEIPRANAKARSIPIDRSFMVCHLTSGSVPAAFWN